MGPCPTPPGSVPHAHRFRVPQSTCSEGRLRVRLADAGGLYLEVAPNGSKRWFVKYRFGGKERRLALGSYPEVRLKAAREGRDMARKTRAAGTDPVQARRVEKITRKASRATTFEAAAHEFHATKAGGWGDESFLGTCRDCGVETAGPSA